MQVTVKPCYEAYASSLQEVYTKKDMGTLDEPFSLAGSVDTGGVTGRSSRMYFTPLDDSQGVFIMIEHVEYFGIPCTVYTGGSYEVVFYRQDKTEGDLITEGGATQVCEGMATSTQNLALRVAFRATQSAAGP